MAYTSSQKKYWVKKMLIGKKRADSTRKLEKDILNRYGVDVRKGS